MGKKVVIALIVLIVFGLGGYFFGTKLYYNYLPATTKETSFSALAATKSDQVCTFNFAGWPGTFYFAKEKVRGEFGKGPASGDTDKKFLIFDGSFTYLWTENNPTGAKIPYKPVQGNPDSLAIPNNAMDLSNVLTYVCRPWLVDNTKFTPPANVTFIEGDIPANNNPDTSTGSGIFLPVIHGDGR